MAEKPSTVSRQAAIDQLWRRGNLTWKLDVNQKELYKLFYEGKEKINTWLLARRNGKSYTLLCLALETCLRKPNSSVKYVAPTKLQVKSIIEPLLLQIMEDCPEDLKPVFNGKEYSYTFHNKSRIELAGGDNGHAEKLRGGDAALVIVDEAGSIEDLEYIVKSILIPTTLITRAKIILASTPPRHFEHEFNKFIERAEEEKTLIKKTIYDNPRLTKQDIEDQIKECGGITSDSFRREYLCQTVRDATLTVFPEFDDDLCEAIVKDWPLPPFYDTYVAMDLGFKDLTVVLFGYYDFRAAKVIIQDEVVVDFQNRDMTIPSLTKLILEKEEKLWVNPLSLEIKKPTLRVSDINYIVTKQIYQDSGGRLSFSIPKKDDKEAAVNQFRVMLSTHKVIIHPRCINLIRHLKNAKWSNNTSKSSFARSPGNGHYDAADAAIYLIRSILYNKNPYPVNYDYGTNNQVFWADPQSMSKPSNNYHTVMKKMFRPVTPWKPNGRK